MDPPDLIAENAAEKNKLNQTNRVSPETTIESDRTNDELAKLLRIEPEQPNEILCIPLDQVRAKYAEFMVGIAERSQTYNEVYVCTDEEAIRETESRLVTDRWVKLHFESTDPANHLVRCNGGFEPSSDQTAPFDNPSGMRPLNQEARRDDGWHLTSCDPGLLSDLLNVISNPLGTLFDSWFSSANQGLTPYNGLAINPNQVALRHNEVVRTDNRSNEPEPGETDRTAAREAPDDFQQAEKSDKPRFLILKCTAGIVSFAAGICIGYRMEEKISRLVNCGSLYFHSFMTP